MLLLDMNGFVAEGPGSNFFFEKGGELYTTPAGSILQGITRGTVISPARDKASQGVAICYLAWLFRTDLTLYKTDSRCESSVLSLNFCIIFTVAIRFAAIRNMQNILFCDNLGALMVIRLYREYYTRTAIPKIQIRSTKNWLIFYFVYI